MPESRWIGRPLARLEDEPLVRGRARFVADLHAGDPLHVVLVRAPVPHARITSIDRAAASRLGGVVDVFVAGDLPAGAEIRNERLPGVRPTTVEPLAADVVRSIGEPVAAVVATELGIAEDAAELVGVDYAPLEAVGTLEQAAVGDPLVYPEWGDNVLARVRFSSEGTEAALAVAPHVFHDRYRVPRYAPMPLEPRGCVAAPSLEGLTLWSSTQLPFIVRTVLAEALGVAETDLRVVVPYVGGGFGAKMHVYGEELLVCLLARLLDRPVRWIETRSEHVLATVHAREVVHDVEVATDAHGRLLALRARVLADMGTGRIFFSGVSPAAVSGADDAGAVPAARVRRRDHLSRDEPNADGRLPRVRTDGSGVRHGADPRPRRARARHRCGRDPPAQPDRSRRDAVPSRHRPDPRRRRLSPNTGSGPRSGRVRAAPTRAVGS